MADDDDWVAEDDEVEDEVTGTAGTVNRRKHKIGAKGGNGVRQNVPFMQDETDLEEAKARFRGLRGQSTLAPQTISVLLHVYAQLKLDYQRSLRGPGRKRKKRLNIAKEVARLTGCSDRVVTQKYRQWYFNTTSHLVEPKRGNFAPKKRRIPQTKVLGFAIRRFVRMKRLKQERVTATQVLTELRRLGAVQVKESQPGLDEEKDYLAALRATQVRTYAV